MAELRSLKGGNPEPSPDVVRACEEAMRVARSGSLRAIAWVGVDWVGSGLRIVACAEVDPRLVVAELELCQGKIVSQLLEEAEDVEGFEEH